MEGCCCGLGAGLICFNEHQKQFTRNRKNIGFFFENGIKEKKKEQRSTISRKPDEYYYSS